MEKRGGGGPQRVGSRRDLLEGGGKARRKDAETTTADGRAGRPPAAGVGSKTQAMKQLLGGCLALVGLLFGFKLAYDQFVEQVAHPLPWWYYAIAGVVFLAGIKMLAGRRD